MRQVLTNPSRKRALLKPTSPFKGNLKLAVSEATRPKNQAEALPETANPLLNDTYSTDEDQRARNRAHAGVAQSKRVMSRARKQADKEQVLSITSL